MVSVLVKTTFYRVVLPSCLILGQTKGFLVLTFLTCAILTVGQIVFQSLAHVYVQNADAYVNKCLSDANYQVLRQIGFIWSKWGEDSLDGLRLIAPEVITFTASFFTLLVCTLGSTPSSPTSSEAGILSGEEVPADVSCIPCLKRVSDVLVVFMAAGVGIVNPCALNSVYFLFALVVITWWSLYTPLRRPTFNRLKLQLILFAGCHLLVLTLYQMPIAQGWLPAAGLAARVLGLNRLVLTDCHLFWAYRLPADRSWTHYASYAALVLLYHLMVAQYKWTVGGVRAVAGDDAESSVHEEVGEGEVAAVCDLFQPSKARHQIPLQSLSPDRPPIAEPSVHVLETAAGLSVAVGVEPETLRSKPKKRHKTPLLQSDASDQPDNFPLQRITSTVVDRQKISFIFKGRADSQPPTLLNEGLQSVCFFLLYHCYVYALLAMMSFALLYHSVFGLVFLVLPCVLWALSDTRKWSFRLSPLIVAYAHFVLIAQYVYSMPIGDLLPQENYMKIVGFVLAPDRTAAAVTLTIKFLLCLPLFVLLRLHLREHFYDSLTDHDRLRRITYGTFSSAGQQPESSAGSSARTALRAPLFEEKNVQFFDSLYRFLSGTWIFVVALVLLLNSLTTPPVLYALGYFIIWSALICTLVLSFNLFVKTIYLFLTGIIVYSSVVIIALYCYQFPDVPQLWQSLTHLSPEWTRDIGLVDFKSEAVKASLFERLFRPLSLLVVTMVQLKFFQSSWTRLVSTPEPRSRTPSDTDLRRRGSVESAIDHARSWLHTVYEVLWRLLELHANRLVLLVVLHMALQHFCALNFVAVALVVLAACLPSLGRLLALFTCVYLTLTFLAKHVYGMHFVPKQPFQWACPTNRTGNQTLGEWLGLEEAEATAAADVLFLIVAIAMIALVVAVKYRQRHYRRKFGLAEPPPGIVFADAVDVRQFDRNLVSGFKVACNYFFYKFGLELALIASVFDAWFRMDLVGTLLLAWVFVFCLSRRSICRAIWPFYLVFCALLLPVQYAMAIGLPQALCLPYPWDNLLPNENLQENLAEFLDLAAYNNDPVRFKGAIYVDFFLLLFVVAQEFVFRVEGPQHPAGHNNSIYRTGDFVLHKDNPHYDFIAEQKSFVDYIKIFIFMYGHWLTMIMVLAAGLGGTSLFALGYIVLAFAMLWQGNNLYTMRHYRKTLTKWYILLAYNVVAMLWKVALQLVGCVWASDMDAGALCSVRQLFSIACVNQRSIARLDALEPSKCQVDLKETKVGLDLLAFIFIIFQLRALHSYFFQRCMVDYRCEIIQASRGAILINQLVDKQMREQHQHQVKKFKEIAVRAKEIRKQYEDQLKNAGKDYFVPQTYGQAKRAGDFYMFNYDPHTEDVAPQREEYVPEVLAEEDGGKLDPAQLIHTAVNKDMDLPGTLEAVESAEKIPDEELRMIQAVHAEPEGQKHRVKRGREADEPRETADGLEMRVRTPSASSSGGSTADESAPAAPPKQLVDHAYAAAKFVLKLLTAFLHWLSAFFNRYSREHRYVAYVLDKEKIRLKHTMSDVLYDAQQSTQNLRAEWKKRGLQIVASAEDVGRVEEEAQARWEQRHVGTKLLISLVSFLTAYTHVLCYILAVMAHAVCAGLITLPLPLMVFLWGSLCNPRPPKLFWICMILYTEFVIVVKFVCQFNFIAGENQNANLRPNEVHYIMGVQQVALFSAWDVAVLIALFAHRYMLRRIGLWKDANTAETFVEEDGSPKRGPSIVDEELDLDQIIRNLSEDGSDKRSDPPKPAEPRKEPQNAILRFFDHLLHPRIRYIRDFYPYIFFLDVFGIFILTLRYPSFGELASEQLSLLDSSRVPLAFVALLFTCFTMIIIERALYLRKAVLLKLIYHVFLIVFLHVWVMVALPWITQKRAAGNVPARVFYVAKCLQLLVSAWQIRNGYPRLCTGNLLTHSYGMLNYVLFNVFMTLPFVFELRTIIDWTWTDTTMPIFDFIKMEVFYAKIYLVKCARVMEQNFPVPRGVPRGKLVKYMYGLPGIFGVILLILSPLLAFALLNKVGQRLSPQAMRVQISLEGYPPLYEMSAQGVDIVPFDERRKDDLDESIKAFNRNDRVQDRARRATSFVSDYNADDIHLVKLRPESSVWWPISTESFDAMHAEIRRARAAEKDLQLSIHLEFTRERISADKEPAVHSTDLPMRVTPHGALSAALERALVRANDSGTAPEPVPVPGAIPYFVVVPNEGQIRSADALNKLAASDNCSRAFDAAACTATETYLAVNMTLIRTNTKEFLWRVQSGNPNLTGLALPAEKISYGPQSDKLDYVEMVVFVDRVFPSMFTKVTQGGILAMYIAVVYLGARILRSVVASEPLQVIIQEMPNPDYLLKICMDIYLVREARDFILEEDLFAKLIFLFRSPATLIKWTRYKVKAE